MTWPDVVAIVMAVVALGGMLVQWRNGSTQRVMGDASAAKYISEAYENLKETLEARIIILEQKLIVAEERATRAEKQVAKMEEELSEYSAGVRVLISQIVSATGEKPLWKPKDYIG